VTAFAEDLKRFFCGSIIRVSRASLFLTYRTCWLFGQIYSVVSFQ